MVFRHFFATWPLVDLLLFRWKICVRIFLLVLFIGSELLFSLALAALRFCEREAVAFTEKKASNNAYRYETQGAKHTG
jgi:hypothetical protein